MTHSVKSVDAVIIGAGVIGLACARSLALAGRSVLILESEKSVGNGISSRNSEVMHAGLYYPKNSLKAKFCVAGHESLRSYAASRHVPFKITGKLIVAQSLDEESKLGQLRHRALENGVPDIRLLSGAQAMAMEPALSCRAALYSPSSGIIDSHALMLALLGEAEAHGAQLALRAVARRGGFTEQGAWIDLEGEDDFRLAARHVVIAAGLHAPGLARRFGLSGIPEPRFAKGSYFSLSRPAPFSRLIYPVPVPGGLGIHYTLDLAGRGKFGPDVEWVDGIDYNVDEARRQDFATAIKRYWPALRLEDLQPAYAGIRPKLQSAMPGDQDFMIVKQGGVIALLGIESPGLTSCLAIGDHVAGLCAA